MTFVSVAQVTTRLGIDAKTLHRWLAQAQFPLQRHPHDGRKKGVSSEHLQLLARRHQRSLAPLPEESAAPEAFAPPELAAALLAVPEQLAALQAQFTALQHQMADLTRLLPQQTPPPVSPAPLAQPGKTSRRSSAPAHSALRTRPAANSPRKPVHVIPRVEYGEEGHYVVICPKHGLLPFEPETPAWFAWLATQSSFRFVGRSGHFTAHQEWRVPRGAWRAHRQVRNHSYTLPLALTQGLTSAVLEQAAATLQTHLT
jgi:transposase-like protein